MNLQQTKFYLDKLLREYNRISKDSENIIRLDVDMMLEHTRQLYDALLAEASAPTATRKAVHAPAPEPAPAPRPVVVEAPAPPPPPPVPVPPPPPPVVEAPPPPPPPVKAAPEPAVVLEVPVPAPPPPPPAPRPQPESVTASGSEIDTLFEEKQAKELSEKLSSMPIADLKKAIPLNDRLMYTKELFAGDAGSFDAILNTLNNAADFAEGKAYLIDQCVIRYGWLDKKRMEHAKDFIKLVRRRLK